MDDTYFKQVWQEYTNFKESYKADKPKLKTFSQLENSFLEFEHSSDANDCNKNALFRTIANLWLHVEEALESNILNDNNGYLKALIKINEMFYVKMLFFKDKHNAIAWYDDNRIPLRHKKKYLTSVFSYDIAGMRGSESDRNRLMDGPFKFQMHHRLTKKSGDHKLVSEQKQKETIYEPNKWQTPDL
ncbi:hypothetical protein IPG37_02880 [bacterium]|nr:MAG: hypothetical protein IPG37_02880 [bacterium]QQR62448.1 MAG: hypothetical protein IPH67_03405 [bacterium]